VALGVIDLPLPVWEGLQVWVVPPDIGLIRETHITAAAHKGDALVLTLEGVDTVQTAQGLIGRSLLALVEDLPPQTDNKDASMLGLCVEDSAAGYVGIIIEELQGPQQTTWVVQGPKGEVLIPAVDQFILSIDDTSVFMQLPAGLLELNQ